MRAGLVFAHGKVVGILCDHLAIEQTTLIEFSCFLFSVIGPYCPLKLLVEINERKK